MDTGLSVQLPHYTKQHRQPSLLPTISLFMLPSMFTLSVNIVLIIQRAAVYVWKKNKLRELPFFLSLPLLLSRFRSLTHSHSLVVTSEALGVGKPSPATVCHIVSAC